MNAELTTIPTLEIQVTGEIVASNAPEFREAVARYLATLNMSPKTGAEFGQASDDAKALKEAEDACRAAMDHALAQAETVNAEMKALGSTAEEIRQARLTLSKAVDAERDRRRAQIVEEVLATIDSADKERFRTRIANAGRGKRSAKTYRDALEEEAQGINTHMTKTRALLDNAAGQHGESLVPDRDQLEVEGLDFLTAEIRRRVEGRAAEAERKTMEEAAAKAKEESEAEHKRLKQEAAESLRAAEAAREPAKPAEAVDTREAPTPMAPAPTEAQSEAEEFHAFREQLMASFAPVKQARAALQFPENQAKAEVFAEAMGAAWKILNA